jgi:hypothetical protein
MSVGRTTSEAASVITEPITAGASLARVFGTVDCDEGLIATACRMDYDSSGGAGLIAMR